MTKCEKIFNIFNVALLLALAFSTLYPFLYTLSMSLSTPSEAVKEGLHLFPGDVTFAAFKWDGINSVIKGGNKLPHSKCEFRNSHKMKFVN